MEIDLNTGLINAEINLIAGLDTLLQGQKWLLFHLSPYNGIKYYNMHNSIIRRNWIRNSLYSGILGIGGHHNLIDRNIVSHNGIYRAHS